MSGVPDLARMAAEAAQQPNDPWAYMVGVQTPKGPQQYPVPVAIFLMLDIIATQLSRVAEQLEQLAVTNIVK